jgi:hypothetical protein
MPVAFITDILAPFLGFNVVSQNWFYNALILSARENLSIGF